MPTVPFLLVVARENYATLDNFPFSLVAHGSTCLPDSSTVVSIDKLQLQQRQLQRQKYQTWLLQDTMVEEFYPIKGTQMMQVLWLELTQTLRNEEFERQANEIAELAMKTKTRKDCRLQTLQNSKILEGKLSWMLCCWCCQSIWRGPWKSI